MPRWSRQKNVKRVPYSTLPIFFTAATSRALSSATNFENSGASWYATVRHRGAGRRLDPQRAAHRASADGAAEWVDAKHRVAQTVIARRCTRT
jgi:hypothetical protein